MRKIAGFCCMFALTFGALASFAANQPKVLLHSTIKGSPIKAGSIKYLGPDHFKLNNLKAQNHLSTAMNQKIVAMQRGATYRNCSGIITIPCFSSWFITGYRNSVYTYTMVGRSPTAGGTTTIPTHVIPLETWLIGPDNTTILYDFNPQAANGNQPFSPLNDVQLLMQGPIFANNLYPGGGGLAADNGQYNDTGFRASFTGIKKANWHTLLGAPTFPKVNYVQVLFFNNGDWTCLHGSGPPCTGDDFPVVNIDTISNIFAQILGPANENVPSTEIPIIETDFVTAFDPSNGGCCVLGFHMSNPGNEGPNSISVWTWGTFIPKANNPFTPFGNDVMVLTHETSELYHDPFVGEGGLLGVVLVSPWVDGSVSFAQANLETGDAVEAMNASDVIFPLTQNTSGGSYTYSEQNVAILPWFTRNPKAAPCGYVRDCGRGGLGVYSWPDTKVLNAGHDPSGWGYGEAPAGFFFGPPF
jgi:hypothetical protein